MAENRKGGIAVQDRPSIAVELVDDTDVDITVISIGDDCERVEINTVIFPVECLDDVIRALQGLIEK